MSITSAKIYSKRLTQKLEDPRWHPRRAHIEQARNTIQDLIEQIEKLETRISELEPKMEDIYPEDYPS